jgi:hypothetical protein
VTVILEASRDTICLRYKRKLSINQWGRFRALSTEITLVVVADMPVKDGDGGFVIRPESEWHVTRDSDG